MHNIDMSRGKAAFAYSTGNPAWHKLGQNVDPSEPIEVWAKKGQVDFEVLKEPIYYGNGRIFNNRFVLCREDTGFPFTVVSARYKVHQPLEVLDFFREITGQYGDFEMDVVGALDNGKAIWGLAKCKEGIELSSKEHLIRYLLAMSSYEEKKKTIIKQLVTRAVCQNTMRVALRESTPEIIVSHRSEFSKFSIHQEMALDEDWHTFVHLLDEMAKRKLQPLEARHYMEQVFYPEDELKQREGRALTVAQNHMQELARIYKRGPGADTEQANGTLYGALNAVTRYVDHESRARNDSNRLKNAWWGAGQNLKNRAFDLASDMISS